MPAANAGGGEGGVRGGLGRIVGGVVGAGGAVCPGGGGFTGRGGAGVDAAGGAGVPRGKVACGGRMQGVWRGGSPARRGINGYALPPVAAPAGHTGQLLRSSWCMAPCGGWACVLGCVGLATEVLVGRMSAACRWEGFVCLILQHTALHCYVSRAGERSQEGVST